MDKDKVKMMMEYPLDEPEEIVEYILHGDNRRFPSITNNYIGWLQVIKGEVMLRVFAYRRFAKKGILYTEVFRRITGDCTLVYKNAYFTTLGGWQIVYEKKRRVSHSWGYSYEIFPADCFNEWYFDPAGTWFRGWYKILNLEVLKETRFKYCAYFDTGDLMTYLERYDADPRIEFFGKIKVFPEKSLIKKANKDRRFCLFLKENAREANAYGPRATLYAYNHNLTIPKANSLIILRRAKVAYIPEINGTCISLEKVADYFEHSDQVIDISAYNDYIKAIKYLHLDLRNTKNAYPKDFWRMHNLRIAEYKSKMAEIDAKKRARLYKQFSNVAEEFKNIEWSGEGYVIILPKVVPDLKHESDVLGHCVGTMGYDVKMASKTSLIAFLRLADKPDDPLYTIEFSLKNKCVIQSHGLKNCALDETAKKVLDKWEKIARRKLSAKKEA